jgi:cell pole-organizing protein PopZ
MRQDGEPSVEEILASIKNVIARDNRAATARQPEPQSQRAEYREPPARQAQPERRADNPDILDLGEAGEMVPGLMEEDDDFDARGSGDAADDAPLLNEETQAAMRESLSALATLAQPGAKPQIVRSGETSLEGMVREMLRPMLAQWLDDNLPGMVEGMVKAEIARIAGKKG